MFLKVINGKEDELNEWITWCTLGGPSKVLVLYSLALSTNWQYVLNASENLLWDFSCEFTRTALLHTIALLSWSRMPTFMHQYLKKTCFASAW